MRHRVNDAVRIGTECRRRVKPRPAFKATPSTFRVTPCQMPRFAVNDLRTGGRLTQKYRPSKFVLEDYIVVVIVVVVVFVVVVVLHWLVRLHYWRLTFRRRVVCCDATSEEWRASGVGLCDRNIRLGQKLKCGKRAPKFHSIYFFSFATN